MTRLGNWGFTRLINALFGCSFDDAMMGYRAYRKSAFQELEMDSPGLCFPTQGSIQFTRFGFRVAEIPSDEPARLGGERKAKNFRTGLELCKMIAKEAYREHVLGTGRRARERRKAGSATMTTDSVNGARSRPPSSSLKADARPVGTPELPRSD
jgi:hypothetical protein